MTTCPLTLAARGTAESCPRDRCAFWEAGGALIEAGCVIERLGADLSRPYLAAYLLELREHLADPDVRVTPPTRGTLERRV